METKDPVKTTVDRVEFEEGGPVPDALLSDDAERWNDVAELAQFERESDKIGPSDA
jgi:hypothetical protein